MNGKLKFGKTEMTEEEFERQYQEATRRGRETLARLPKADSARYDRKTKRLVLNLKNGTTLLVPVQLIQGLQTDDEELLNDFQLMIEGSQIHWDKLDVQFYVKSLLDGVFGTKKWMESLQKRANKSTSKTRRPQKNAA